MSTENLSPEEVRIAREWTEVLFNVTEKSVDVAVDVTAALVKHLDHVPEGKDYWDGFLEGYKTGLSAMREILPKISDDLIKEMNKE